MKIRTRIRLTLLGLELLHRLACRLAEWGRVPSDAPVKPQERRTWN